MLEGVGVEVARGQRRIGQLVVVEHHDLDVQAVLGGDLLDHLEDLLAVADGDADLERVLVLREGGAAGEEGGGQRGKGEGAAAERGSACRCAKSKKEGANVALPPAFGNEPMRISIWRVLPATGFPYAYMRINSILFVRSLSLRFFSYSAPFCEPPRPAFARAALLFHDPPYA